MKNITIAHCFHQYLNTTENWAYRLISNLPETRNIIITKKYLKNNFYSKAFAYIEFPLSHINRAFNDKSIIMSIKSIIVRPSSAACCISL